MSPRFLNLELLVFVLEGLVLDLAHFGFDGLATHLHLLDSLLSRLDLRIEGRVSFGSIPFRGARIQAIAR